MIIRAILVWAPAGLGLMLSDIIHGVLCQLEVGVTRSGERDQALHKKTDNHSFILSFNDINDWH